MDDKNPNHFDSADHVPAKERPPKFGLGTIDENSWLIGDRAVITRRHSESWPADTPGLISTWTDESDGAHYAIVDAPVPPPRSRPWTPEDAPSLVYLARGGEHDDSDVPGNKIPDLTSRCVYRVGGVFIKMHHTIHCESADEHVTIKMVREQLPDRSFEMPDVLYHAKYDDRYYLVTTGLAGETADSLWWALDDSMKDYYAELIVRSLLEVATLTSSEIATAIDGSVHDNSSFRRAWVRKGLPDMMANCKSLGMDLEPPFCLSHGNPNPTNIIIDHENRRIGIVDWQNTEFVPREWLGMLFGCGLGKMIDPPVPEKYRADEYPRRLWEALKRRGFRENWKKWVEWISVDSPGALVHLD